MKLFPIILYGGATDHTIPLCHTYSESSGRAALQHGTIPIQQIDGDAIPRPQQSVIFKVWVISATSMHEITLCAIDMHKIRSITIF